MNKSYLCYQEEAYSYESYPNRGEKVLLSYQWKNHTIRGLLTLSFSFSMLFTAIFHKQYSFGAEISAHVEGVKTVMNTFRDA